MGYRRESMCRYCFLYGHTKRNCPSLPEYMKNVYKEKAKNRECAFCALTGHNRASCEKRKIALAKHKKDEILRRQALERFCRENGIGVGAVLSYTVPAWNKSYYKIDSDVDTLILKSAETLKYGEPRFNFHSSAMNGNIVYCIASVKSVGEWGSVVIPFSDSEGNKTSHHFYPDIKVEVLIPAIEGVTLFSPSELTDESTVEIPDNLRDTVRRKKEVDGR